MAEGPFTFHGEHYTIDALDGQPKPVQLPHPPIVVGGGGPKVLALAAKHAQIVGINANLRAGEGGPSRLGPLAHCARPPTRSSSTSGPRPVTASTTWRSRRSPGSYT